MQLDCRFFGLGDDQELESYLLAWHELPNEFAVEQQLLGLVVGLLDRPKRATRLEVCNRHRVSGLDEQVDAAEYVGTAGYNRPAQFLFDADDTAAWLGHSTRLERREHPLGQLAEAVNYALHRWPTLVRYLDDGDLSIDTNHVEREIRPLAIGRTNWLFLGHERAGATASALYTVLQSARLQQVDLLPYLTDVLRGLPAVERSNAAGVDVYLPDRWLAAHPQHRLIERERESQDAQRRRRLRHAARRAGTAG